MGVVAQDRQTARLLVRKAVAAGGDDLRLLGVLAGTRARLAHRHDGHRPIAQHRQAAQLLQRGADAFGGADHRGGVPPSSGTEPTAEQQAPQPAVDGFETSGEAQAHHEGPARHVDAEGEEDDADKEQLGEHGLQQTVIQLVAAVFDMAAVRAAGRQGHDPGQTHDDRKQAGVQLRTRRFHHQQQPMQAEERQEARAGHDKHVGDDKPELVAHVPGRGRRGVRMTARSLSSSGVPWQVVTDEIAVLLAGGHSGWRCGCRRGGRRGSHRSGQRFGRHQTLLSSTSEALSERALLGCPRWNRLEKRRRASGPPS